MRTPRHHFPDDALFAYATGAAPPHLALIVATHCALCPACRARVDGYESVGAALLDEVEPVALDEGAEARLLAALDAPEAAPAARDGVIPAPLFDLVGPASALAWRWSAPGIRKVELDIAAPFPARLFELSPGIRIPEHRHEATERTLVITGGFTDDEGHFGRGDVALRGPEGVHRQRIDEGEPCIALVVNDGPLVPTGLVGRIFQALTGA